MAIAAPVSPKKPSSVAQHITSVVTRIGDDGDGKCWEIRAGQGDVEMDAKSEGMGGGCGWLGCASGSAMRQRLRGDVGRNRGRWKRLPSNESAGRADGQSGGKTGRRAKPTRSMR